LPEGQRHYPSGCRKIAGELLANDIIQQWAVFDTDQWDPDTGIGFIIPKVILDHQPEVATLAIDSDDTLAGSATSAACPSTPMISHHPRLLPQTRHPAPASGGVPVRSNGCGTGVYLPGAQRSLQPQHLRGRFHYRDLDRPGRDDRQPVQNLYRRPYPGPQRKKPWVVSVLWDNAGVGRFDDRHYYVITGETHNSPSNMEAYGGAITGIVGIYRDPMGTGKGSR
jgi:hypothetical protein